MEDNIGKILSDPQRLSEVSEAMKALFAETPDAAGESAPPPVPGGEKEEKSGPKLALLCAIKPFMGRERQEKIDKIMKVMSLAELYGTFRKLM